EEISVIIGGKESMQLQIVAEKEQVTRTIPVEKKVISSRKNPRSLSASTPKMVATQSMISNKNQKQDDYLDW
ncbi:MAG: hypothetical protein ACI86H_002086, partial [bacterium]